MTKRMMFSLFLFCLQYLRTNYYLTKVIAQRLLFVPENDDGSQSFSSTIKNPIHYKLFYQI